MIITTQGVLIRMPVEGISVTGRNTQGVRLIRLQEEGKVATVARIVNEEDEEIIEDQSTTEIKEIVETQQDPVDEIKEEDTDTQEDIEE